MLHDRAESLAHTQAVDTAVVTELIGQIQQQRPEIAHAIPTVILKEMVVSGLQRAHRHGLCEAHSSFGFVALMFEIGANIDSIEPLQSLLHDRRISLENRWGFVINNLSYAQWQQLALQRDDRGWYPDILESRQKSYFLDSQIPQDMARFLRQGRKDLTVFLDLLAEELALASIEATVQQRQMLEVTLNQFQSARHVDPLFAARPLLELLPKLLQGWLASGKRETTCLGIVSIKKAIVAMLCKIIGLERMINGEHAAERVIWIEEKLRKAVKNKHLQNGTVLLRKAKHCAAQTHNGQKRDRASYLILDNQVCVTTGELLMDFADFAMHGPLPLVWQRHYCSSDTENNALGVGWRYTGSATLQVQFDQVVLFDEDARIIQFDLPEVGQGCRQVLEDLVLRRDSEHNFSLQRHNVTDVFVGSGLFKFVSVRMDRNGNEIRFQRDKQGRLVQMVDSCGRRYFFSYDTDGLIIAISLCDSKGNQRLPARVYYKYDKDLRLVQAIDSLGQSERYHYAGKLLNKRILKSGYSLFYEWDGANSFARCAKFYGQTRIYQRRFSYSTLNRTTAVYTSEASVTQYQYNENGRITKVVEAGTKNTHFDYTAEGKLQAIVDAKGQTYKCQYNIYNDLLSFENPLGHTTRFVYDTEHRPIAMHDAQGGVWRREYDRRGNVTATVNALGRRTQLHYNAQGLLEQHTDPVGRRHQLNWHDGLLATYQDASGKFTHYHHDELAHIVRIVDWVGLETRFEYDLTGRILRIGQCDGGQKLFKYDPLGNLLSYTDEKNQTFQYVYHGLPQPLQRIDKGGRWVHYEYDDERRITQLQHEGGDQYHFSYDVLGRLVQLRINSQTQTFAYDELNHVVEWQCDGAFFRFERNALGAVIRQETAMERQGQFSYDPIGRLLMAKWDGQTRRYLFNAAGYLLEEQANKLILTYEYDKAGRRITTTTPGGGEIRCMYDANGSLSSVNANPIYQYKQAEEMPAFPSLTVKQLHPVCPVDPNPVQSHGWISENIPYVSVYLRAELQQVRNFFTGCDLFAYAPLQPVDFAAGLKPKLLRADPAYAVYARFHTKSQIDVETRLQALSETYLANKSCNLLLFAS